MPLFLMFLVLPDGLECIGVKFLLQTLFFQTYCATWPVDGGHNKRMPKKRVLGGRLSLQPIDGTGRRRTPIARDKSQRIKLDTTAA